MSIEGMKIEKGRVKDPALEPPSARSWEAEEELQRWLRKSNHQDGGESGEYDILEDKGKMCLKHEVE